MQTATVNITEYFEQIWKSYEKELEARVAHRAEHLRAFNEYSNSILNLVRDRDKKKTIKTQALENGLDTSPLDKDIARISTELDELQKRRNELDEQPGEPGLVAPYDRNFVALYLKHLASETNNKAEVLRSIQDAASRVTVSSNDLTPDENGLAIKAIVRLAGHPIGTVPISPESGRHADFARPYALGWLSRHFDEYRAGQKPQHRDKAMKAFIVEESQALLLPSEFACPYVAGSGANQTICVTGKEAPFALLSKMLADALKNAGATLRLDKACDDAFLERIRQQIVAVTFEGPRWATNTEYPDSDKVMASIREDLLLLTTAPWSDHIRGALSMLKFTLENGERPRVWRKEDADHYGLRLRTRDHTWIVGELFIDRTREPGKSGEQIQEISSGNGSHDSAGYRIGRMYGTVRETRAD